MKKKVAIILNIMLVMAITISACGTSSNTSSNASSDTSTTTGTTTKKFEPVTITKLVAAGTNTDFKTKGAIVLKAIFEATGVNLELVEADPTKIKILLAANELPDIIDVLNCAAVKEDLIKGNHVIPLDDLLKSNGSDIVETMPESITFSKKFWSNNTGNLYFIPSQVGADLDGQEMSIGACIRFDYYKELGLPKVSTEDDLLKVLSDMVKKYPKTPDGKTTYGVSSFTDWGMNYQYSYLMDAIYGYQTPSSGNNTISVSNETNIAANNYTDLDAPYWKTVGFFYKANKLGIFDKEGLSQKYDDFAAKMTSGQIFLSEANWDVGNFNTINAKDSKGFMVIPMIPGNIWKGAASVGGWSGFEQAITTNCKTPDRAMDLINYLASFKGSREMQSGLEGEQWDMVNGKPVLKDSVLKDKLAGKDNGLVYGQNLSGLSSFTINPVDGEPIGLYNAKKALSQGMTALQEDYSKSYSVSYPNEIFEKLINEGTVKNQSKYNMAASTVMAPMTSPMKLIDAKLVNLATISFARCILSKSDAEFKANQDKAIADFKAAGADKLGDFYIKAWNDAVASIK